MVFDLNNECVGFRIMSETDAIRVLELKQIELYLDNAFATLYEGQQVIWAGEMYPRYTIQSFDQSTRRVTLAKNVVGV